MGLGAGLGGCGVIEQRQRQFLGQAAHLPQRLAAIETERAEGIRRGEALERGAADAAPPPQVADVSDRSPPLFVMPAQAGIHYPLVFVVTGSPGQAGR